MFRLWIVMTVMLVLSARPARAQVVMVDDPLNGSTTGTRSGGTFAEGGWKVVSNLDSIYWHLAPTVTHGRLEYDIKGLNDGCAGCCYPGDGQPFLVNELSHMYDHTFQNADTNYIGYRNNPYKHAVKRMCYSPPWTMKLLWIADGEGDEDWAGHGLSWNAGTTYRITVEWEPTGTTSTEFRTYRSGQLVHSRQVGKLYNPAGHSVKIGSALRTEEAAYIGAVYSNVKVTNLAGDVIGPGTQEVWIDLGATNTAFGMTHPQSGDGNTVPATIGGREARRNANSNVDFYFYFGIHDAFAFQGSRPVLHILMDYYDTGTGALSLQFDSMGAGLDAQYKAGGSVALTNTNTWKTKSFSMTDTWFGNRQNSGADFRIAAPAGSTFYLDRVVVTTHQPVPPIIAPVTPDPDPIHAGTQYVRQLTLTQGFPEPTWSVLAGPAGMSVDASGLVSGWTPAPGALGDHPVEVQATNSEGVDTHNWIVRVLSRVDFDGDGDVDITDFAMLQRCLSGDASPYSGGCDSADLDGDLDVDATDFAAFLPCMNGPFRDPGC